MASIAFGVATPVMDGNVERVLSRCLALDGDPRASGARRQLLAAAAELLDPRPPGRQQPGPDGAGGHPLLAAPPQVPPLPPALRLPRGRGRGTPSATRLPKVKREAERHRLLVAVVEDGVGVLLFRRPEDSTLLAGTWELPWVDPRARRRRRARRDPEPCPRRPLRRPLDPGPADRRSAARHHLPRPGGRRPPRRSSPGGARCGTGWPPASSTRPGAPACRCRRWWGRCWERWRRPQPLTAAAAAAPARRSRSRRR